jgi:hypothetical protein
MKLSYLVGLASWGFHRRMTWEVGDQSGQHVDTVSHHNDACVPWKAGERCEPGTSEPL